MYLLFLYEITFLFVNLQIIYQVYRVWRCSTIQASRRHCLIRGSLHTERWLFHQHGGTNFDRTAGEFIATSYDYDAPLDEYGLPREPKYSHLKRLHKVIKLCEPALVSADPTVTSLGDKQEVMDAMHINTHEKRRKTSKKSYLPFRGHVLFFRLTCSSLSHLALLFSQTTTQVLLQESCLADLHMICLLGLSVFYPTC
jgi:hypothetical protein